MGVPRGKHTKSKKGKHRLHIHLEAPFLTKCPKCGKPVLPHTACLNCGYYKGREIIDVLKKLTKKERKKREKEMKEKETEEKGGTKEKPLTLEGLSRK